MPHYKLFYFGLRGRGEPIRQLFKLAGVPFDNVTYTMEEWPQHKSEMPLGQLPVLEVDGVKIAQTVSIMRYLGHQFRRAGSNPLECAKLDMIAEVVQEMGNADGLAQWGGVILGFVKANKEEYFKEKIQPVIEKFAPTIERFLVENGGNGLFIGNTETWVDVLAAEFLVRLTDFGDKNALNGYPHIGDLIRRVHRNTAIAKHIAERQPTPL